MTANGGIFNFWSWREQNDKKNNSVDVDLTPLAGRSVRFILTVLATGSAAGDRVRWIGPTVVRMEGATPPPITPVPPTTPPTNDWLTYTNTTYGFEFKYPPQSQVADQQTNFVRINLPIQSGTNLGRKYLETVITENTSVCQSPFATLSILAASETVNINGTAFLKQTGGDAGAGNYHDWVAYSTTRNNYCLSMSFVLHYTNPGNYDPPIPVFDRAAESAVFLQIMQTLAWTPPRQPIRPPPRPAPIYSPTIRSLHMIDP